MKEKQWNQLEKDLRLQIAQLEAAIKTDMSDKTEFLNQIQFEKGLFIHSSSFLNFKLF